LTSKIPMATEDKAMDIIKPNTKTCQQRISQESASKIPFVIGAFSNDIGIRSCFGGMCGPVGGWCVTVNQQGDRAIRRRCRNDLIGESVGNGSIFLGDCESERYPYLFRPRWQHEKPNSYSNIPNTPT
jgi:hypothetical protein